MLPKKKNWTTHRLYSRVRPLREMFCREVIWHVVAVLQCGKNSQASQVGESCEVVGEHIAKREIGDPREVNLGLWETACWECTYARWYSTECVRLWWREQQQQQRGEHERWRRGQQHSSVLGAEKNVTRVYFLQMRANKTRGIIIRFNLIGLNKI